MAKRPGKDHDATMDVSMSQLVVPSKRPVPPSRNNPKNDMSLWGGVVVGTQDFAPAEPAAAKKRPWLWIVVALAVLGAGVGAFVLVSSLGGDKPAPSAAPAAVPSSPAADAAVAMQAPDAAVVPDAAVAVDAGVATADVAAAIGEVDAISGVAPIIKPAVKKKPARKVTRKKKPAPKKKRR